MNDYIELGLDKCLCDPDNGANISRKRAQIQASGLDLQRHPKHDGRRVDVLFGKFAGDFVWNAVQTLRRASECCRPWGNLGSPPNRGSRTCSGREECTPSFRGIAKGYRFFKSGHVQNIEFHNLPDVSEFCYVRAKVLPSMVKNKMYSVTLCLRNNGDVHVALCVCPAGLAGSCNHVAALIYALEEFVRLGLREESRLPCTSKLQAWNKPRARNVEPMPVHSVELVAEQYRKKRSRLGRNFDLRLINLWLPDPVEQSQLLDDLQKEHEKQLAADKSGDVKKYGSSCVFYIFFRQQVQRSQPQMEKAMTHCHVLTMLKEKRR